MRALGSGVRMDATGSGSAGSDWTDQENDLLVADYFAMFGEEMAGRAYVKAHHRRAIVEHTGRSEGSVERKYMNVSAVLIKLGLPRIRGYAPNDHAQFKGLSAAIDRYLSANEAILEPDVAVPEFDEAYSPFVEVPVPRPKPERTQEPIERLARKFDPAVRDAANRALGKKGEAFVLEQERRRLIGAGRADLVHDLRWVADLDGDGAGYDIRSFDPATGDERLIEVKSTYGESTMPFFVTSNEESLSLERPSEFRPTAFSISRSDRASSKFIHLFGSLFTWRPRIGGRHFGDQPRVNRRHMGAVA
jgi:hypothetical protein